MSLSSLEFLDAPDDGSWDEFVQSSPQGTVFSTTDFLHALGAPYRRFVVRRRGIALAQIAVVEDERGHAVRFPFTPYQGILFSQPNTHPSQDRLLHEFRLTQFIVQKLTATYSCLTLSLSWNFLDLRPFLWHNHGQPAAPQFRVTPRYTAVLPLAGQDSADYLGTVRACRRQELRKSTHLLPERSNDVETFLELYQRTFSRQHISVSAGQLSTVRRIVENALARGFGWLSGCRAADGMAAMALFVHDRRRAYYLLAANDPDQRHTFASTRLMFQNIEECRRLGFEELDFVGANSPARGDFKLSFNPRLKLYFELDYQSATCSAA